MPEDQKLAAKTYEGLRDLNIQKSTIIFFPKHIGVLSKVLAKGKTIAF